MSSQELEGFMQELDTEDLQRLIKLVSMAKGDKATFSSQGSTRVPSEVLIGVIFNMQAWPERLNSTVSAAGSNWKAAASSLDAQLAEAATGKGIPIEEYSPANFNINVLVGPDPDSHKSRMKATIKLRSAPVNNTNTGGPPKLVLTMVTSDGARAQELKAEWTKISESTEFQELPECVKKGMDVQVRMQFVVLTVVLPELCAGLDQEFLDFADAVAGNSWGEVTVETMSDVEALIQAKDRPLAAAVVSAKLHFAAFVSAKVKLLLTLQAIKGKSNGDGVADSRSLPTIANIMNGCSGDFHVASVLEAFDALPGMDGWKGRATVSELMNCTQRCPSAVRVFLGKLVAAQAEVTSILLVNLPGNFEIAVSPQNVKCFKLMHELCTQAVNPV